MRLSKKGLDMMKEKKTISDYVFDFIFGMAVNDATNLGPKTVEGEKEDVLKNQRIKEIVREYSNGIINGTKGISFSDAVDEIEKAKANLSCGKIQKIINMTMKYLFIRYYDNQEKRDRFEKCDAPMDSIMRDFVFESYYVVQDEERKRGETPGFSRDCSWSSLTTLKKDYKNFQNAIDFIIEKKQLNINRIEFDFIFWEQAKKLQYKHVNEQKEITKSIWK